MKHSTKTYAFTTNSGTLFALLFLLCNGKMVNATPSLITAPTVERIYPSLMWLVVLVVFFLLSGYRRNVPVRKVLVMFQSKSKRAFRFKPSDCLSLIDISLRGIAILFLGIFGVLALVLEIKATATGIVVVCMAGSLVAITGVFGWIKFKYKELELELRKTADNQSDK